MKFIHVRPSTIVLATILFSLACNIWVEIKHPYPTDFLTEEEISNLMGLDRLIHLMYYVPMTGLYFFSRKNPYIACMAFFIIHIYLCSYIFFQPIDLSTLYGAVLLLMSYLANLQAHRIRRHARMKEQTL